MTKNVTQKGWTLSSWKDGTLRSYPQPANKIGINLNGPVAYATGPFWLNALKQCASNSTFCPWFTGSTTFDTQEEAYLYPTLDANGNPTTLTVSGIPGGQQFTKLFTYIYVNMPSPPSGATTNYTLGQYTFLFKIGGNGAASTIQFQLGNDVSSLASQTAGVTVSGNTVTSTLSPGSSATLTFNATSGNSGFVITIPVGAGISPSCYFDFAGGYLVPTTYLSNYTSGQILHPAMKAEFVGNGYTGFNGPIRWMTIQRTYNQEWTAKFTANLASGATSGTLSSLGTTGQSVSTWPWPTGTKNFVFSTGQVIPVSGTYGQAAVSWSTALSSGITTSAIGAMALASEQNGWANRPVVGNLSWAGPNGPPIEAMIQACNELGRDIWFCVPLTANLVDNTWLTKFSALLHTGAGANITGWNVSGFSGLNSAQKAYIEFANETWGSYPNLQAGCDMMGVPAGYYAAQSNNQYYGGQEWYGTQCAAIGQALGTEYGYTNNSGNPYAIAVCMNQFATGNGVAFMNVAMNTPDWGGGPASKFIGAFGFAPYGPSLDGYSVTDATNLYALGTSAAITKIFSHMWASDASYPSVPSGGWIGSVLSRVSSILSGYSGTWKTSLPLIGYEGGSALDDVNNIESSVNGWRANILNGVQTDPRFQYIYYDPTHQLSANDGYLPGLQSAGFSFICQLSDASPLWNNSVPNTQQVGSHLWGASQSYMQILGVALSSTPYKYQSIINWINA